MSYQYKNIILLGFRATGKSTLGKKLAKDLGWQFVDMDTSIENKTGQTIEQLTRGGSEWVEFRSLETEVLEEVLEYERVVIAAGGGVGVNSVVDNQTGLDFGQIQKEILDKQAETLNVLLTASKEMITDRLRLDFEQGVTGRPSINSIQSSDIEAKITSNLKLLDDRVSRYMTLTPKVVDTGKKRLEDLVAEIKVFLEKF